ncbi:hypothetical protein BASA81_003178 [Batrachochytrium salamandrivorans]|nr:hypothetical protein BASA81_003178 [Batrachochytrium salamandrivorans]
MSEQEMLKSWLKSCEDKSGFDFLHWKEFFQRELEQKCHNLEKDNLLVQILKSTTTIAAYRDVYQLEGFSPWLDDVFNYAKECDGECSETCSKACVLQVIFNITRTSEILNNIVQVIIDLRLLHQVLQLSNLCRASLYHGINMLDNLLQHREISERVLTQCDDSLFDQLLALFDTKNQDLQQGVQSILISLAKVDQHNRLFQYRNYAIIEHAVGEVANGTSYLCNALIMLTYFTRRNTLKVFSMCNSVLKRILKWCTSKQNASVKLNSIKLVSLFFAKRMLIQRELKWIMGMQLNCNDENKELAMWSVMCLAFIHNVPSVTEVVLLELGKYLNLTNMEENFPLEVVLDGIKQVLQIENQYVKFMRKANLGKDLMESLKIAFQNQNDKALRNCLGCLEIIMKGKKRVLKSLTPIGMQMEVMDLNKLLLLCYPETTKLLQSKKVKMDLNNDKEQASKKQHMSMEEDTPALVCSSIDKSTMVSPQTMEDKVIRLVMMPPVTIRDGNRIIHKIVVMPPTTIKDDKHTVNKMVPSRKTVAVENDKIVTTTTPSSTSNKLLTEELPSQVAEVSQECPIIKQSKSLPLDSNENDDTSLVRLGLISQAEYEICQRARLPLAVLRLADDNKVEFTAGLRIMGFSSLSATRLLVAIKPHICGGKDILADEFAQSLFDAERILSEEMDALKKHQISRNVLMNMQEQCFADANISIFFKAKLRSVKGELLKEFSD